MGFLGAMMTLMKIDHQRCLGRPQLRLQVKEEEA